MQKRRQKSPTPTFAERVRQWRVANRLSYHQAAARLRISWSTIHRWERGGTVVANTWDHAVAAHPPFAKEVGEPTQWSTYQGGSIGLGTRSGEGRPYVGSTLPLTKIPATPATPPVTSSAAAFLAIQEAPRRAAQRRAKPPAHVERPHSDALAGVAAGVDAARQAFQQLASRSAALREEATALQRQVDQIEARVNTTFKALAEAFRVNAPVTLLKIGAP